MTDSELKTEYPIQYNEGREACRKDKGDMEEYHNPYSFGNHYRAAWALGWGDEFAEFMKSLHGRGT